MRIIDSLNEQFPIRKTRAQKAEFRAWIIQQAEAMGYAAREEKKGGNVNVVIGDVDSARVLVTAHYDTPPQMPIPNFITPANVGFFLLYQVGMVAGMFLLAGAVAALVWVLTKNEDLTALAAQLTCLGLCGLLMFGPANPHNVNDNTSGVAAVMEAMGRIPAEDRAKVAFVLFDNEEKGMLGSSAFARLHKQARKQTLVLNMDCVGDGEYILMFANKKTRALPEWPQLAAAMEAQTERQLVTCEMEKCIYPSDQASFKLGVAFCACKKGKRIGYYCDKIHTKHDTVCDQANLDHIAGGVAQFIRSL